MNDKWTASVRNIMRTSSSTISPQLNFNSLVRCFFSLRASSRQRVEKMECVFRFSVLIAHVIASLDWRHLYRMLFHSIDPFLCVVLSPCARLDCFFFSPSLSFVLSLYFHVSYWKMWFDLIIMTNLKLNNFFFVLLFSLFEPQNENTTNQETM